MSIHRIRNVARLRRPRQRLLDAAAQASTAPAGRGRAGLDTAALLGRRRSHAYYMHHVMPTSTSMPASVCACQASQHVCMHTCCTRSRSFMPLSCMHTCCTHDDDLQSSVHAPVMIYKHVCIIACVHANIMTYATGAHVCMRPT